MHKQIASACFPLPCNINLKDIEFSAANFRPSKIDENWVSNTIHALGGSFNESDFIYEDFPLLVADGMQSFSVFLPKDPLLSSKGKDWFSALALGHMILHWPPPGSWGSPASLMYIPMFSKTPDLIKARREATQFAIELLMPGELFFNNYLIEDGSSMQDKLGIKVHQDIIDLRIKMMGFDNE